MKYLELPAPIGEAVPSLGDPHLPDRRLEAEAGQSLDELEVVEFGGAFRSEFWLIAEHL